MTVSIKEITAENWIYAARLKVKADQKNFFTNAVSIAQSKFEPYIKCHGIYIDDKMVGFSTTGQDPEGKGIWIVRYMIDEHHQGRGYGKAGLQEIIQLLKQTYHCSSIFLTVEPENTVGQNLYFKAGFVDTGEKMGNGLVYELKT